MKTRFFTLLLLTFLLTACSQDETNTTLQDEANLQTTIALADEANLQSIESDSRKTCLSTLTAKGCDSYVPRVIGIDDPHFPKIYSITYNSSLSLEEVACIRKTYFTCFSILYMHFKQNDNPYNDHWLIAAGYPGGAGSVAQTVDEDDRISTPKFK